MHLLILIVILLTHTIVVCQRLATLYIYNIYNSEVVIAVRVSDYELKMPQGLQRKKYRHYQYNKVN
jgi:hypothetical protein